MVTVIFYSSIQFTVIFYISGIIIVIYYNIMLITVFLGLIQNKVLCCKTYSQ